MPAAGLHERLRLYLARKGEAQYRRLRQWRDACLPGTAVMVVFWGISFGIMALGPAWPPVRMALAIIAALLPLIIALHWLIQLPRYWDIDGSWIALVAFAGSAVFALIGHGFAAVTLNDIFHDSPGFFPIAQFTATAIGAVLGVIGVTVGLGLILVTLGASVLLCVGIMGFGRIGAFLKAATALVAIGLFSGFALGSLEGLERLGRDIVLRVALNGDFFARHRCDTGDWPTGVTRVAFVGDQQVLGYRSAQESLVVLDCVRVTD